MSLTISLVNLNLRRDSLIIINDLNLNETMRNLIFDYTTSIIF